MQRVLHFSIAVLILLAASRGRAQTSDLAVSFVSPTDGQGNTSMSDPISVRIIPTPVVTVEATEPFASTSGPGVFTISRTGDTSSDLQVPYFVGGTADYGVDYSGLAYPLTIPAGQSS